MLYIYTALYSEWESLTFSLISSLPLADNTYLVQFKKATQTKLSLEYNLKEGIGILNAIKSDIDNMQLATPTSKLEDIITKIFDRFHKVVKLLRNRHYLSHSVHSVVLQFSQAQKNPLFVRTPMQSKGPKEPQQVQFLCTLRASMAIVAEQAVLGYYPL